MRSIRRSEGFTLIELMIVVAIIGILAAIAIPNFLKFQCRSKQSEAKTQLSGLFTSEKSFFGEYTTFGSDLLSVNWGPDGAPVYIYGYSATFPAGSGTAAVPGIPGYNGASNNTMVSEVIGSPVKYSTVKMKNLLGIALTAAAIPVTTVSAQTFIAGAAGDVDTDGATAVLDQWTINELKALQYAVANGNDCAN